MKIQNPYNNTEGFNCFGCSDSNEIGLHLKFDFDNGVVTTRWRPTLLYQGWNGMLHGGVIATLLDEAASWTVQAVLDTCGVTATLNVNYIKPVMIEKGEVRVEAVIQSKPDERHAIIEARLYDSEDVLCAKAETMYYVFSQEEAREKFNYCGHKELGIE